jgi:hypothetical protein
VRTRSDVFRDGPEVLGLGLGLGLGLVTGIGLGLGLDQHTEDPDRIL